MKPKNKKVIQRTDLVRLKKAGDRPILFPAHPLNQEVERHRARIIKSHLENKKHQHHIHHSVHGIVHGRGIDQIIFKTTLHRDRGGAVITADIEKFFQRIDLNRLRVLEKKASLPSDFFASKFINGQKKLHVRGIPQGYATSPFRSGIYITPIMKRLWKKGWEAYVYIDDLTVLVKKGQTLDQFLTDIDYAFRKNCHTKPGIDCPLRLSRKQNKAPRFWADSESFNQLGVKFCSASEGYLLPIPGKSAHSFFQTILGIRRRCERVLREAENSSIRRLADHIDFFLIPQETSSDEEHSGQVFTLNTVSELATDCNDHDEGSTSDSRSDRRTPRLKLTQLNAQHSLQCSLFGLESSLLHSTYMEKKKTKLGSAMASFDTARKKALSHLADEGFAGVPLISTFGYVQSNNRRRIIEIFNSDQTLLNYLYDEVEGKRSRSPKQDYKKLPAFLDELHARTVGLFPADLLTVIFRKYRDRLKHTDELQYARDLAKNELRLINKLHGYLAGEIDPSKLHIPAKRLQLYLRGCVYQKLIELNIGRGSIDFTPGVIRALGTFVWGHNDVLKIIPILRDLKLKKISWTEFESRLLKLKEELPSLGLQVSLHAESSQYVITTSTKELRKRIHDPDLIIKISKQPCLVCGAAPADVHHVTPRFQGGSDSEDNLMPLCRRHHDIWHTCDLRSLLENSPSIRQWLVDNQRIALQEKHNAFS